MSDIDGIGGIGSSAGAPAGSSGGAAAAGALIRDTTAHTFAADVLDASMEVPVIVDFWAPWCGPCKQLTPVLEKVVTQAGGKVRLVKMNIDEHPQVAQQLRVQSIPAVFAFKNGQPVDGFMGALPESQVKRFVEALAGGALAPTRAEQLLEAAAAAMEAGDIAAAGQAYAAILQDDEASPAAIAGLARCYLEMGDTARAREVLGLAQGPLADDPDIKGAAAALDLAEAGGGKEIIDVSPLRARIEADPDDHQARIDLAVALAAGGDRDAAADELLESISRERTWNEEAARAQLLQFFEAWGPMDEATQRARRKLSSLLFS